MGIDNPEIESCVNEKFQSKDTQLVMSGLGLEYDSIKKEIRNTTSGDTIKLGSTDGVDPNGPEIELSFSFTELGNWLHIHILQSGESINKITVQDGDPDIWGLPLSKPADIYSVSNSLKDHWDKKSDIKNNCERELKIQKLISDFQDSGILSDLPSLEGKTFGEIIFIPEQSNTGTYTSPSLNYRVLSDSEKGIAGDKYGTFGNPIWSYTLGEISRNIDTIGNTIPFPVK